MREPLEPDPVNTGVGRGPADDSSKSPANSADRRDRISIRFGDPNMRFLCFIFASALFSGVAAAAAPSSTMDELVVSTFRETGAERLTKFPKALNEIKV